MAANVTVVDYGVGNLRSVCHAFEYSGATVSLSDDPGEILRADRLVLPGVGAVAHCLGELDQRGMRDPLRSYSETGRPFLGICVGMQMMLDASAEFGEHSCFGWVGGNVVPVPKSGANGPHKIPHIGWSPLMCPSTPNSWNDSIMRGIPEGSRAYFVHSFMAEPEDPSERSACTEYNGVMICAAVQRGAMAGTQFHPEKSGAVGLRIIRNFLAS